MIFAAIQSKALFNWFDVALVLVLAFGFWRGRKNGMAKEFLPVCQWLVIVFAAGLGYEEIGNWFIGTGYVRKIFGNSMSERTAAYISAYLAIAGLVWIIFYMIKKFLKPKLEGSNAFGSSEYYLGMVSGVIRYACIMIFALALLNAPVYSSGEIQAQKEYNNRWYGGGMQGYSGDFIPAMYDVQNACFVDSRLGPYVKSGIGMLFIGAQPPGKPPVVEIK